MQAIKPEILIFSVFQKDRSNESNLDNHQCIIQRLSQLGIGYKVLDGVYQGETEKSILVVDSPEMRQTVESVCKQFNQDCYLKSDSQRNTSLVYQDGTETQIGTLKRVSQDEAQKLDGYSVDPTDGSIWATI